MAFWNKKTSQKLRKKDFLDYLGDRKSHLKYLKKYMPEIKGFNHVMGYSEDLVDALMILLEARDKRDKRITKEALDECQKISAGIFQQFVMNRELKDYFDKVSRNLEMELMHSMDEIFLKGLDNVHHNLITESYIQDVMKLFDRWFLLLLDVMPVEKKLRMQLAA